MCPLLHFIAEGHTYKESPHVVLERVFHTTSSRHNLSNAPPRSRKGIPCVEFTPVCSSAYETIPRTKKSNHGCALYFAVARKRRRTQAGRRSDVGGAAVGAPMVVVAAEHERVAKKDDFFYMDTCEKSPSAKGQARRRPRDEPRKTRELSRGLLLPALGRRQLPDLQPRDVDSALLRTRGGLLAGAELSSTHTHRRATTARAGS
jgi:hypothetical protein